MTPKHVRTFLSLLAPKNTKVLARALLAVGDASQYKARFAKSRDVRSRDEDDIVDPWLEIVDALEQAKLSCSIDWKFAAVDIHWNLVRVLRAKGLDPKKLFAFYDEDAHLATKTDAFITACGSALSAHGLALVELDISSDSYELTVVPWKDIAGVQAAAKAIGGKVVLWGPKKPLAEPLPAAAKKPVGKFQSVRVAGDIWEKRFEAMNGFCSFARGATTLVDCTTWPPKKTVLDEPLVNAVVHARGTIFHWVTHPYVNDVSDPKASGTLRVRDVDLLPLLPDHFDVRDAGFVGDLVVLLPTEPTVRGKVTRRPLVWNGKKLAPALGLRDAVPAKPKRKGDFPSFLRQGFATTGSGIDVLVWEGEGWIAKGGALKKVCGIDHVALYDLFVGAPAEGDAFVYLHRKSRKLVEIREVRFGAKEIVRAKIPYLVETPVAGIDRTTLLGVNRYAQPKAPALVVWHEATNETTDVPATAFGIPRDENISAYGVGGKGNDAFLWVLEDSTIKRISWANVLALPRTKA